MKEVTEDVVVIAKRLDLEVESEDVTEFLVSHGKTSVDEGLLIKNEQRKCLFVFSEIESAPGETAVRTIEMTTNNFKYYVILVDKALTGFERIESNFDNVLLWVKCYQIVLHATEKLFMKGSVN